MEKESHELRRIKARLRHKERLDLWMKYVETCPEHIIPWTYAATESVANYNLDSLKYRLNKNDEHLLERLSIDYGVQFVTVNETIKDEYLGDYGIYYNIIVFPDKETRLICDIAVSFSKMLEDVRR